MESQERMDFFEDGFQGFPRMLPENCVQYVLFIIDSQLEARKLLSALENVRKGVVQLTEKLTTDYIWHRDGFHLQVNNDRGLIYLQGTTYYGDSVEDEWLIVYMLRELTKSFGNLWVRVFDSDGEFLLVEAANVLPSWLNPEIDSNRVWIHQAKLYIIPLAGSGGDKRPLSLKEAVEYLQRKPESLVQSAFIETEAFYRLEKFPGQITNSIHYSMITIPRKLAYILHEKPAAIAPAVEAFYLRDPISLRPLLSPSRSTKLSFPPQDLVTVGVKFTKVLFAQLKSQRFSVPSVWKPIFEATEKEATDAEHLKNPLARLELGMKVTAGFEMLATNAETKDNRITREVAILLGDLEEDDDQVLPSDATIFSWPNCTRDDDESWMDINYEDFERELEGKRGTREGKPSGFGDASAQADLQKIVSRFETFLNDESAGHEGAELDDMDEDDDLSDDGDDSEGEDKDVSFDEEQFAKMMKEMMGIPMEDTPDSGKVPMHNNTAGMVHEPSDNEDDEIRQLSAHMEAELNKHGALQLDPTPKSQKSLKQRGQEKSEKKAERKQVQRNVNVGEESSEEGEGIDIDYNLARNLLESFKSQGGLAGPAGNILGMMGMRLPRDEDDIDKK